MSVRDLPVSVFAVLDLLNYLSFLFSILRLFFSEPHLYTEETLFVLEKTVFCLNNLSLGLIIAPAIRSYLRS